MGDYKNKLKEIQRKEGKFLQGQLIDPKVAKIKDSTEYGKEENYRLNFHYYNHRQCELPKVTNFKVLIDKFNYITDSDNFTFRSRGRVDKRGDYLSLYSNIPVDVTLEEIETFDTGRIFFFRAGRYCCIVAVSVQHKRV